MNAQERDELLEKMDALVGEHCNGYVFLADIEADEFCEGAHESVMVGKWTGGVTLCTGLLYRGLKNMPVQNMGTDPDEEDTE